MEILDSVKQGKANAPSCLSALEATQGQMDCFFGQLPYTCHLEEVASVGDCDLPSDRDAGCGEEENGQPLDYSFS